VTDPRRWLRGRLDGPGMPLICLPHAGAGASAYRGWLADPAPGIRPLAVKLPGREDRIDEPLPQDLDDVIVPLAAAVSTAVGDEPYAIFGHSMGAILGFELARRQRRDMLPEPAHLFVSGSQAPDEAPRLGLHQLDEPDFLQAMADLDGTDEAIMAEPTLLRLAATTLRADLALCDHYTCADEPALSCPITVVCGDRDPRVSLAQLRSWQRHTRASLAIHLIAADHFPLRRHRAELMAVITARLAATV
jgi:pyochelin biosynthesis protein PchC